MSPDWSSDPEAVPYANLQNPQSLNLYDYVGDNPLGGIDANGHCWGWLQWFCNAGKAVGHAFVRAYQWDSRPRQNATVTTSQIITGVGSSGKGNGERGASGSAAGTQQTCLSSYYNSKFGRVVDFGSFLGIVPGWSPNARSNFKEIATLGTAKYAGVKSGVGLARNFDSHEIGTLNTDVKMESWVSPSTGAATVKESADVAIHGLGHGIEVLAVGATVADIEAHYGCWAGANPQAAAIWFQNE